ncbi:acetoin utilization protein AcuC [Sediminihabitans luteus]|uniref:Acetoin utilization protein AcuC n=1 Tax=Sediminihabitans luteus TaxID=1138585 RepID=A0A2M9CZP2_9CELL|nr:acetoin utilization protein AcuC [Sediminihabitans luteus]PJJ77379.1 acetoin utilization protein AcuC [Sediminihabitans luteus]GII98272.1 acetoin utilization protein AcuC [Sediminihabitans luteus]
MPSSPSGPPSRLAVLWTPEFLGYDFGPGHPMAPTRLDLTVRLVRELGIIDTPGIVLVEPEVADDAALARVHEPEYVAAVRAAAAGGVPDAARGLGTQDDPVFGAMHEAAARIFGASQEAARLVWSGEVDHAVNVAGGMHHAMPGAASGFCIYNDAAAAVRRLLDDGAERVAYVDLDAHHGDGVEAAFWDDPRVLTVSVHQSPMTLFPGTGYATDTGGPRAPGSAVNVALPPRTDAAGWLRAVDAVVPEALRAFAPQAVVSQHGCDAHSLDPLSDLRVSVPAQRTAARWVHELAHELCDGRWVALGGGGYAVVKVVPFAWTHVLAEAAHRPIADGTPVPEAWRAYVEEISGESAPATFDAGEVGFASWSSGYDPDKDLDRVVQATRNAAFPLLGLDPLH